MPDQIVKIRRTPLKAIRVKCLECQANKRSAIRICESTDCSLFAFRMGRNPHRKGIGRVGGNLLLNSAVRL